jgi:hypothetical protein
MSAVGGTTGIESIDYEPVSGASRNDRFLCELTAWARASAKAAIASPNFGRSDDVGRSECTAFDAQPGSSVDNPRAARQRGGVAGK